MPPSSRSPMQRRVLLLVAGSGLSAFGYLHSVVADLGNGPLFAVQDGLRLQLGLSLGVSAIVLGLLLVAVAGALRAPLGVGTVLLPIVNGVWIVVLEHSVTPWHGSVGRWAQFVAGTSVMMLGAVVAVAASFGASAMDGVMLGLAQRLGVAPARARLGMELGFALTGAMLGGSLGVGTVVMGATVGHLFQFWSRVLAGIGLVTPPTSPEPSLATASAADVSPPELPAVSPGL